MILFRATSLLQIGTGIFCAWMGLAKVGLAEVSNSDTRDATPNFIVILADDLHYSDVGCFGSTEIPTPNIDALAAKGIKLTSFYVSPVCSPTRAALMTGCYPIRVGLANNVYGNSHGLAADQLTLPALLKQRGYTTGCIGKWMLGGGEFLPTRHGFDVFYGLVDNNRVSSKLFFQDKPQGKLEQADMTDAWTTEAIKFIKQNRQRPFFLYLAHTAPHFPQVPHARFKGKSQAGNYGDEVVGIDWSTGQIMQTLRELDLEKNTLVIFTSDNGRTTQLTRDRDKPQQPRKPQKHGPLRGQKGQVFEGGVRVPCIAFWPGNVPAGSESAALTSIMDLLPTFARLAGADVPANQAPDGGNILPLLLGEKNAASPYTHYFYYSGRDLRAVRRGSWKYFEPGQRGLKQAERNGALFDLEADLGEQKNLAGDHPDVVAQMVRLLEKGRRSLGDGDRIGADVRAADPKQE